MSLGKKTKCYLSAGKAKIDLEKLTNQMEIHFFSLMEKMEKRVLNVRNKTMTIEDRKNSLSAMSAYGADDVMRLAIQIEETTELLHTLYETSERKIEIV